MLIENPETIRLIEELSRRTGETPERAVDIAVRERLARLRTPEEEAERWGSVAALTKFLQDRFKEHPELMVDHGELLYGEDGLPREGELSEVELRFYFPERYTLPDSHE